MNTMGRWDSEESRRLSQCRPMDCVASGRSRSGSRSHLWRILASLGSSERSPFEVGRVG